MSTAGVLLLRFQHSLALRKRHGRVVRLVMTILNNEVCTHVSRCRSQHPFGQYAAREARLEKKTQTRRASDLHIHTGSENGSIDAWCLRQHVSLNTSRFLTSISSVPENVSEVLDEHLNDT